MILRKVKNYFFIKNNLDIGQNTRILTSLSNFGSEPYLIKIGSNCTITSGVKFITHDASIDVALRFIGKKRFLDNSKFELMKSIIVKDNCMIGVNSIILPGVEIGPNSIVGAGSVVTKSIPAGVVVAGNPARVICTISEYYEKIEKNIFLIPTTLSKEERKKEIKNKLGNH